MIDQFGRSLSYLRLSVVDRCNLRCLYCMPAHGTQVGDREEIMTYEEMALLVRCFAELGIRKVRITGGEPLARKEVPRLVEMLCQIPGIEELALSTNGVFLAGQARALKQAGLDRVNVSLDTLNPNRFREIAGIDRLNDVLDGIEEAIACGLTPLKINTVLMKGINDDEILDLVRFAAGKEIEIRFIELMPTNHFVQIDPRGRFLSSEIARAVIEKEFVLLGRDAYFSSPAQVYSIAGTNARVGFISPLSNLFCSRCNRLRLKANGALKTCLHGIEDLNLKALLRAGVGLEEIKRQIEAVVFSRPEQHFLNESGEKHHDFQMSQVGG